MSKYKIVIFNNKLLIVIAIFISLLISFINVGVGVTLNLILDSAMGLNNYSLINILILAFIVFISEPIMSGIFTYLKSTITQKNNEKLKSDLLQHIENIDLKDYNKYHSGELLTRLNNDSENVSSILSDGVIELIKGVLTVIISLIYAIFVSFEMTVTLLLFMPLLFFWGKYAMPKLQSIYGSRQQIESDLRIFLQEQIQNITFIKSFQIVNDSVQDLKKINKKKMKLVVKSDVTNQIAWGGGQALGSIGFLLSVGLGCYFVSKGEMTVGSVMGFSQVINYIIWPFTQMMGIIAALQNKLSSKKRVEEIFNIEEEQIKEVDTNSNLHKSILDINTDKILKVENLKFYYEEDNIILDNINIDFERGKLTGIIGESGCGKSKLLKLLLGLYVPQKGKISIQCNGEQISGKEIREYISYVPQNNFLMSGTIKENLLKGNKEATFEQLKEATKKAHIHDIIESLPNKYETVLGEFGAGVSLGQAQRLAIARALLRNKPIIILDEPTASLDPNSEKIILETIKEISKNYICIMVAHGEVAYSYCDCKIKLK